MTTSVPAVKLCSEAKHMFQKVLVLIGRPLVQIGDAQKAKSWTKKNA